jgi:primary-amine oxidase
VARDGEPNPHGTTVAPGVNAHYHQHLFSFRIDPMIDGLGNSLVETDVIPLPDAPTGSAANHAGNAFIAQDTVIRNAGGREWDYTTDRKWKIVNAAKTHYSSGKSAGYTIVTKAGAAPFMPRLDSWVAMRAAFATKSIWVCKDVEAEDSGTLRMWPAGKYVPQTRGAPLDSIGNWVKGGEPVENDDILVFVTIGESLGASLYLIFNLIM